MELSIPEKFLLLAQHPTKGKFIISGLQLQYGIAGSVLLEMSVDKQIEIRNKVLVLNSTKGKSNPVIVDLELQIRDAAKPRKIRYWINKLARRYTKLKNYYLEELQRKRIIRIERKKFLGLIPYKKTYLVDSRLQRDLIRELKKAVLSRQEISNEQVVLLGLIEACKMQKIFTTDPQELKRIKKALKEIIKDSPIAGSIDETIKQVQAAIFVTMIATTAATSSSH